MGHGVANTTLQTHVSPPNASCLGSYEHDERLRPLLAVIVYNLPRPSLCSSKSCIISSCPHQPTRSSIQGRLTLLHDVEDPTRRSSTPAYSILVHIASTSTTRKKVEITRLSHRINPQSKKHHPSWETILRMILQRKTCCTQHMLKFEGEYINSVIRGFTNRSFVGFFLRDLAQRIR